MVVTEVTVLDADAHLFNQDVAVLVADTLHHAATSAVLRKAGSECTPFPSRLPGCAAC